MLPLSSRGTSCGFTNIKSNWNMSRSDMYLSKGIVISHILMRMEIFMVVSGTAFLTKPHLSTRSVGYDNLKCMWKFWPQDVPGKCWAHLWHVLLTHWRHGSDFKSMIFNLMQNSSLGTGCETGFSWWLQNLSDNKSTLVQVKQSAFTWVNADLLPRAFYVSTLHH